MSKRYGIRAEISLQHMDEMYPVICEQHEFEIPSRAYREGVGLTGFITHHKNIALVSDEGTGNTYEVCVVWSSAPVKELEVEGV